MKDRPGWKYIGPIAGIDGDCEVALCSDEHGIRSGDILAFASSSDSPLRSGTVKVIAAGYDWFITDEHLRSSVPALCDTDVVFKAMAIGESAIRSAR